MPAIRVPLRERRNVRLSVRTDIPCSHADNTPTKRFYCRPVERTPRTDVPYPKRNVRSVNLPRKLTFDLVGPSLNPVNRLTTSGLISLHRLIPLIYVSLHPGSHLPRNITTSYGSSFTHIIKITHDVGIGEDLALHTDQMRGLEVLTVTVPKRLLARLPMPKSDFRETILKPEQLLAARDFLSLALPYVPDTESPTEFNRDVRTLITAPAGPGAAADVMAVAICYLAYTSLYTVRAIAEVIRKERESIPAIWRYGVPTKEEMLKVLRRVVQEDR